MNWIALFLLTGLCFAEGEQQFANIGALKLVNGEVISNCKIGYRTYGKLNADKSNAVLFPTWFSGRTADLAQFVAADKLVDPAKFFVVTVDALGNGVSSSFPRIAVRDMVESQHLLLTKHLGIQKLHAVVGISMGGMQTFEWVVAYPDFMKLAIPIIGSPKLATPDLLLWQGQLSTIEAARDPREGLQAAYHMHMYALQTPEWNMHNRPSSDWAKFKDQFRVDALSKLTPEDWASQLRAMIATDVTAKYGGSLEKAAGTVRARMLVIVSMQDHMVNPQPALDFARLQGAEVVKLDSDCGHRAATGCQLDKTAAAVRPFLER